MLKKGEVDIISVGLPNAVDMKAQGFDVQPTDIMRADVWFWGTQMPGAANMPAGNPKVREALSLAIDRAEIRKELFHGLAGDPVPHEVAPWIPGVNYSYWVDYAAKKYVYDPVKAKHSSLRRGMPTASRSSSFLT